MGIRMEALFGKKLWMKGTLGITACLAVFMVSGFVSRAAEGKVSSTAKIRAEASTDSEVIGSTTQGKTVDIIEAVKDASGTIWYKVPNGNNTFGYIRGDLIETDDQIEVKENTSSNSAGSSSENAEKPADTVPTAIGEQQATISQSSVRVRSGASTQHDTVTSLPEGTSITLIGEANDSAGKKWYQMTCSYNNKTIEGYVRSDMITIGGGEEASEEEGGAETPEEGTEGEIPEAEVPEGEGMTEEPESPPEPEHQDYEIVYTEDAYWIYDNLAGTRQRYDEVMNAVSTAGANIDSLQKQLDQNKIIIIILAVVIVLLVVLATVFGFKFFRMRELYYEDYEDDEEEEEEEEPAPVQRRSRRQPVYEEEEPAGRRTKRPAVQEEEAPVRKRRPASQEEPQKRERPARTRSMEEPELKAAENRQPAKKSTAKAKNFLLDDDEFEFEFLNMDDKDL